jgi:hypothetical protein
VWLQVEKIAKHHHILAKGLKKITTFCFCREISPLQRNIFAKTPIGQFRRANDVF